MEKIIIKKKTNAALSVHTSIGVKHFLININKSVGSGSMTFHVNLFRLKDISPKSHFVEYNILSKFHRKVSKFV